MFSGGRPLRFQTEGDPRSESDSPPITVARSASVDYFKTLRVPLIAGRTFRDSDDAKAPHVIVINHTLARKYWGMENPVGKRITFNNRRDWATIIGIVGDVKELGLNAPTPYQVYMPLAQRPYFGTVLVRASTEQLDLAEQIRGTLREVEPQMAIVRIETMQQARAHSIASPRTLTHLFSLFALLAFVIAVAGIGSMLALWVRQRIRETGIRMALGASPRDILVSVMRQGMMLACAGLLFGILVALGLTHLLNSFLFQVNSTDVFTFTFGVTLLLIASLLACFVPARRAARVDPQVALRCE
jgi:putative ABC transport system permease protein